MGGAGAALPPWWTARPAYVLIGKLGSRTADATNQRLRKLISRHPRAFATITADNGCEFHGYAGVEERTGVEFYFARPYHSWQRGTSENTNGLIRQYLPKGCCMDDLTQARCNAITDKLNRRPRKRHGFRTPAELFEIAYLRCISLLNPRYPNAFVFLISLALFNSKCSSP